MAPEKVGDAWDEFEVAAWLGFTFLFQQSGYNFFCSSANTCGYRTDHQGLMRWPWLWWWPGWLWPWGRLPWWWTSSAMALIMALAFLWPKWWWSTWALMMEWWWPWWWLYLGLARVELAVLCGQRLPGFPKKHWYGSDGGLFWGWYLFEDVFCICNWSEILMIISTLTCCLCPGAVGSVRDGTFWQKAWNRSLDAAIWIFLRTMISKL